MKSPFFYTKRCPIVGDYLRGISGVSCVCMGKHISLTKLNNLPRLCCFSLQTVYTLLKSKSEQERRLLTALVNKVSNIYLPAAWLMLFLFQAS